MKLVQHQNTRHCIIVMMSWWVCVLRDIVYCHCPRVHRGLWAMRAHRVLKTFNYRVHNHQEGTIIENYFSKRITEKYSRTQCKFGKYKYSTNLINSIDRWKPYTNRSREGDNTCTSSCDVNECEHVPPGCNSGCLRCTKSDRNAWRKISGERAHWLSD